MAATEGERTDDSAPKARARRRHHAIASVDALTRRAEDESRATGQSLDECAAVVVEDLEGAAAALNTRVAPLVPGCGVLVAVTGLLLKAEPSRDGVPELFIGLSVLFAVAGFAFLARGLFLYAGRRLIGLTPTVEDIAFAHARLLRKHRSAQRGGTLAAISLTCLIVGVLLGVHIEIGP